MTAGVYVTPGFNNTGGKFCTVAGCPSYNIYILIGECWFFLNDQHSPIIKKIQSSKSWYLQIALILSIENPLPRGVVDKAVNTNPEVRGIEPPMKQLRISKNDSIILYFK